MPQTLCLVFELQHGAEACVSEAQVIFGMLCVWFHLILTTESLVCTAVGWQKVASNITDLSTQLCVELSYKRDKTQEGQGMTGMQDKTDDLVPSMHHKSD